MGHGIKHLILFSIGGWAYLHIELLWRGHTHWSMFVLGGIVFLLIGQINEYYPWDMPPWKQCSMAAGIITVIELVAGCILNLWLGYHVWNYNNMPLNLLGQICLPFMMA